MKASSLAAFLALSSVAALPACSMFGGSDRNARQASTAPTTTAANPSSNTAQSMASTELSPDMIRKVQQNLKDAGLYRARVDGVWGPQTGAAVRNYQQQHNINATGQLDQPTLDAMNLGTNNANQSSAGGAYNQNGGQPQTTTYNPQPNTGSGQANYNPPPNNTSNQNTSDTNGSNTSVQR